MKADLPLQLLFDHPILEDFAAAIHSAIEGKADLPEEPPSTSDRAGEVSAPEKPEQDPATLKSGLHQLFEAQVRRTPDASAIVCSGKSIRFSDLNEQANRLAFLLRDSGVGEGTCVAILMDRSPEMVVAMLAILKAGGAWLPRPPAFHAGGFRFPHPAGGSPVREPVHPVR